MRAGTREIGGVMFCAFVLAGCGGGDGASVPPERTTMGDSATTTSRSTASEVADADPLIRDLCEAVNAALDGETDRVRSTFDHGPLHTLADEILETDRGAAADLLVAKEAVDADLADPETDAATIAADLDALVQATAAALAVTGPDGPTDCQEIR